MNRDKIIRQFVMLIAQLKQQIARAGDPACREKRFDNTLFPVSGPTLTSYLQQTEQSLDKLHQFESASSPAFLWLTEKMAAQCQALQRELATAGRRKALPEGTAGRRKALPEGTAGYWRHLYQQQLGYEARLNEMLLQHEQQLTTAGTLQQQQEIGEKLRILEQRLARCRLALKETHWQTTLHN
ncbi:primosomal replication protein PriC [Tatumella terrea]|uniref:Primosomal replication protein PriC n=1 Tax=Tatumella terrea TaxID=419007 RepID=A0ABW1VY71_9GAMM